MSMVLSLWCMILWRMIIIFRTSVLRVQSKDLFQTSAFLGHWISNGNGLLMGRKHDRHVMRVMNKGCRVVVMTVSLVMCDHGVVMWSVVHVMHLMVLIVHCGVVSQCSCAVGHVVVGSADFHMVMVLVMVWYVWFVVWYVWFVVWNMGLMKWSMSLMMGNVWWFVVWDMWFVVGDVMWFMVGNMRLMMWDMMWFMVWDMMRHMWLMMWYMMRNMRLMMWHRWHMRSVLWHMWCSVGKDQFLVMWSMRRRCVW